uniref:Reverse transcriptase domain-containing protein n=1 Tax=Tanacetum cinerariifolium TaxID=118510 RepID=A0A6L2MJP2_TANCI|nr:hypothetical protein [Tanacetum cinerariifolium]
MVDWICTCVTSTSFSICLNKDLYGYFKGGRGLRQGDPISPYLFTLVIEVFTLIINNRIQQSHSFKYHSRCKEIRLTHLCFAYDLLVLCYGSADSVKVIKEALDLFSIVSGLKPNMSKSTIFFGNVDISEKKRILEIVPFQIGKFLMRYLGVPLITKRLGKDECKQLADKVKNKVGDLKNKFLSNAGDMSRGKAKISWKTICKPKMQGGLGFKDLGKWNEVLLTKHIWNITTKKDTLWVQWIHMILEIKLESILSLRLEMEKISQCETKIMRICNNGNNKTFSASQVWKDYSDNMPKVSWGNLQERNKRQFTSEKRPGKDLLEAILETVRFRLARVKLLKNSYVDKVAKDWGIKFKYV